MKTVTVGLGHNLRCAENDKRDQKVRLHGKLRRLGSGDAGNGKITAVLFRSPKQCGQSRRRMVY